jgi:hypothetical protein
VMQQSEYLARHATDASINKLSYHVLLITTALFILSNQPTQAKIPRCASLENQNSPLDIL